MKEAAIIHRNPPIMELALFSEVTGSKPKTLLKKGSIAGGFVKLFRTHFL